MKKNLIKYGITAVATFLLAVSSCFSWGEEISPRKTITLYRLHAIHTGDYTSYDQYRYKNKSSIKYDAKDTALIYAVANTVPTGYEAGCGLYPKLLYKQFLTKDSLVFDTIPRLNLKYESQYESQYFWLSEDGTHYYYSDPSALGSEDNYYINIKENKGYYLDMEMLSFYTADAATKIIIKGNNYFLQSFSYCVPTDNDPTYYNGLKMWDSVGNDVAFLKFDKENKPIYYMDQSPDEKHIAAFHCADLCTLNVLEREYWMHAFGHNPFYSMGVLDDDPATDTATVALIRIYDTDDISQYHTIYRFNYIAGEHGCEFPKEDTTRKAVQTNLPFRFSQDGSKLYIQNLFGQPIGPAEHQEYYCFVSDLENLTDKEENTPIDTIYLGYPLRQAHWFNNDKNVLIIDDSTNKITVLETENYTKVNEVTLKSANGRLLQDFQVFPEGDLVVGYNDPLDTNDRGTIQLFKLSSISGVEDDKEITSVLYPNPTTQSAVLNLTLPTANEIDIIVSDLAGKQLQTQFCGLLPEGISQIEINTSALSSGSYFVTAKGKNFSKTFKLIVKR